MKEVTISSKAIPASPRSKNYPVGSTVVRTGGGNTTITLPGGGGSNIDVLKTTDAKSMTDSNVLSSLRTLLEIRSRIIASTNDETALTEDNTLSSLHTIAEIDAAIKSALKDIDALYLSKAKADTAAETITFLKGLFVGDNLAFIDANGDAEVRNIVARIKAKVATLEVTGDATTLNLLVQELATIYDLDVTHVATMFRTIIKDYVSSETFIPGLMGEGMKIYKALNGDWNLEIDNVVVRKVMTIFELVISKIRAVNGGLVISAANGRIKSVSETTGAPTYYVIGIEGDMEFVADDLVRCQVFTTGQVKYYWVPVASVTADSILVLKSEFADGVAPVPGDDLIQMGNRTNTARQGLLYLTASEDGKPRFSVLDGVDSTSLVGKSKVILGCLDGMTDTDFPADFQPSGYGLYAMNVFLKGVFLLRNGKSVESEIETAKGDASTAKEKAFLVEQLFQEFTMAGGVFESKITEVKTYTDTKVDGLQTQIDTHSTAIEQNSREITLKASQSEVNGLGNRLTSAETLITPDAIRLTVQSQTIEYANLAAKLAGAKMLYRDPTFKEGNNGINVYNNSSNGTVAINRINAALDNPTDSGYQIKITSIGYSQDPGRGGFYFGNQVHIYGEYICKFIAWIPVGSNVCFHSNSIGDGGYQKWLTPTAGQGKWTEYVSYVRGGSANASSTNFYAIDNGADTLDWWLCYATVFECSSSEDTPTRDEVKAGIGITSGGITVFGKTISLSGAVTFSSLDGDSQNRITSAQSTANAANGAAGSAQITADSAWNKAEGLKNSLGGLAYDNAVTLAKLDSTIVEGGYIKTNLINARAIVTGSLLAEQIAATNISTGRLTVTDGAMIGGMKVSGDALTNEGFNNNAYIILRNDPAGTFVGIGANILPSSLGGARATGKFECTGYNYNSPNTAMILKASGSTRDNVALDMQGRVKTDGSYGIGGYYEFNAVWNGGWRKAAFSFTNGILTAVNWV